MSTISDPSYQLPLYTATQFHGVKESGANMPISVRGVLHGNGRKDDLVVKLMAGETMGPSAAGFECLAAFIAQAMGIHVVEPALVCMLPEFVATIPQRDVQIRAEQSLGLNYGSLELRGMRVLGVHERLPRHLEEDAQMILLLDLLIQNPDRTTTKPNCLVDNDRIVTLDHEKAFSFVRLIGHNPTQWLKSEDHFWVDKLILWQKLHGSRLPEERMLQALSNLDEAFWTRSLSLLPEEWRTHEVERAVRCLNEVTKKPTELLAHLNPFLA